MTYDEPVVGDERGRGEERAGGNLQIPFFPEKKEIHLKKSIQSESVEGRHRSVKKFSDNDFERTNNLILNSEKTMGSDLPRLWASLSICWGSNAQVRILLW